MRQRQFTLPSAIVLLLAVLPLSPALADDAGEPHTLFHGEAENGLYFAPSLSVSRAAGKTVYFSGFRGAWIVNHRFAFGYGAYGMGGTAAAPGAARTFYSSPAQPRTSLELDFRYRGAELEYIGGWKKLLHWGVYALAGSGTVSLGDPDDRTFRRTDTIFIAVPAITMMLNLTNRITAAADVSWRAVSGVDLGGVDESDIAGFSARIELRIGKF